MTFTHASYTVAWICALPLELAAAKVFLDEVHPRLSQPESDHNVYTLGSVSGNNVVVACLPAGVYGTTSATAAVSHLMSTYQNVRFGLMVGVGGGVPRENPDIRLGDIVVSKPTDTSSGVIQYDYGKTLQSGQFCRTGSLNKPPLLLLKVIAQMESDSILGKCLLSKIIASYLQKDEVRGQFLRPSKDLLFESTYKHIGANTTCLKCDPSQLVDRPEREAEEPRVHYGLVASGNQVMKDARTRDSVARDQGILCFEMEAAGIMDEVPSLVIRGICDYCDSHKHKDWQPYAAFVAAAYAKAVLLQVPFQEQTQTGGMRKLIPKKRHWMVPFRKNPGFVGREGEISKVEELFEKINGPSKVALYGLGGVGKTQIALELAYRVREKDPTCSVFWLPCTSNASVEQAFLDIAQTIGLQEVKPADAKERVKAYLSQDSSQKWLLIFDNADDMEMWVGEDAGATELAKVLPYSEQGHIIFTTRNRKVAVRLASPFVINVSEPNAETGVKILENALLKTNLLENGDATIDLLEQLMFLPLAISQAAAYINANDIQLSDYTALLKEQESDVVELLSEDFGDDGRYQDAQNPVATTWLISFQQVQLMNPLAADYLSFMACINPRDIPQSLLPEAPSRKQKIDAIGLLKAFSFVSEQVKDRALSLHRLVQLSTRNWLRGKQQFSLQIQRAADRLSQVFPDDDYKNRTVWREYLPHALSLIGGGHFQKEQEKHTQLVQNVGRCLRADGRYLEAAVVFKAAVKLQTRERGYDDPLTLASMADLTWTYWHQGRWKEAEELGLQVTEIRSRVLGPEHPDTLASMAHLSFIYSNQGRWKEAEELKVRVMEVRSRVLGPEHPNTLDSMPTLAFTYLSQGRLKEAEELGLQVIEIRSRVLGPEHPDTLASMAHLSSTYSSQGRWKEAEELQVQVVEIQTRVLGPEHPDTLASMAHLASTYLSQGRWKEADELQVQVIEIQTRVLGPEHPDTLASMAHLSSAYSIQGRWKDAEELEVRVMETQTRVLGPEHPNTLDSLAELASIHRDRERWKDAEELEVRVIEARSRLLGPEHPDTMASIAKLASTYLSQGRWKEAEELQVQVVEIQTRVLGPEHPDTLASMAKLASTYLSQGRWKEAEELKVQVMEIRSRVLGPEHPNTLDSLAELASIHRDRERWKDAEELEVRVIEARSRLLGPEHPDTMASIANLASTYFMQGRWKEAEELEVQVMEIRRQVLGSEHPETLASMAQLSSTYSIQGRWKEAEELGIQVKEIHSRVLGPEHPDTMASIANLASTYFMQGRWKEAEELEVQVMEIRSQVLGPEHPDTVASITNLASTYLNQGRLQEAEELEMQVKEIQSRVLGPEQPETLTSMANLAYALYSQESIHDAVVLMEKETVASSTNNRQSPVNAEKDRPIGSITQDSWSPAVVITNPGGKRELFNSHQGPVRPGTPLRIFLETHHPLLLASRVRSPVMRDHDLHEVD